MLVARRPSSSTPRLERNVIFQSVAIFSWSHWMTNNEEFVNNSHRERSMRIYYVRNKLLLTQMPLTNQERKSREETKDVSTQWKIIKSTAEQRKMFHHWLADLENSRVEQSTKVNRKFRCRRGEWASQRQIDCHSSSLQSWQKKLEYASAIKINFAIIHFDFEGVSRVKNCFRGGSDGNLHFFLLFLWKVFSSQSRDVDSVAVAACGGVRQSVDVREWNYPPSSSVPHSQRLIYCTTNWIAFLFALNLVMILLELSVEWQRE